MRRSRLFLIVAVAAMLLAVAGLWQWRSHERDGSAALARGLAALNQGTPRIARVELMNAIKEMPRSAPARAAQARVLAELGDGAGAQAEAERARALGQSPAATRVAMAQARLLQGDAQGALVEVQAPDVPAADAAQARRVEARATLVAGDPDAARAMMERAVVDAPGDVQNWVELAQLRRIAGNQAGAIMAADRAVALSPVDAKALAMRGTLTRAQYGLVAALPWFDRALAADPASVPVLEQYAATLADAGRARQALGMSRRLLAIDPANARAWMIQAVIAARADDWDLARVLLTRTGGRIDAEPATQLLRGVLQMQGGNAVLAVAALQPLVAAQPDNRTARTLLGRAYYLTGDYASAASMLAPIVAQRDAEPYVLTLAARVQEGLGDGQMAADMLARAAWPVRASADAIASPRDADLAAAPPGEPASADANIPYIRALLSTGQAGAAVARAGLLSNANPGAPDAWIILGDSLRAAGQADRAARAYEAAASLRFDRGVAMRLCAAWLAAGQPGRSVQVLRLFLSQNPGDVAALRLVATIAVQREDWQGARRALQAVRARVGDNDALLMAGLAEAAMQEGDGGSARVYAAHAYRLMPGNPIVTDRLGWILTRTGGRPQAAVDLMEKAVAMVPDAPLFQWHLGQAYAAAGRKAEAKLALGRAAATPGFAHRQDARDAMAAL